LRRVGTIAVLILVLDQLTKWLVVRYIHPAQPVPILDGFFQLVHWRNTGAAWGILRDYNFVLAIISVLTVLALYLFRHTFGIQRPAAGWALGLIAGGILGNVIDRIRFRAVVDFLDFYNDRLGHWPAFNVADSAICVGVVLYIIVSWRNE
jgi:signal peptidase II